MQSEAHQLSRLVWLVGLGWLLVVGLTAWLWGRTGEQIGGAAWVASVVTGVLGVAFGALLARRRQIALAFAMALLGAFAATVVFTIALFSGPDLGLDSYYPGWEFVLFVVVLGVPLAVGAAIAGLWRLSVRVRGV